MPTQVKRGDVATVLTACGIETWPSNSDSFPRLIVATVLTACGIETYQEEEYTECSRVVATVLTACGIETRAFPFNSNVKLDTCCNSAYRLRY